MGTSSCIFTIFTKGNNFTLFASLDNTPFQKMGSALKRKNLFFGDWFLGEQILPLRDNLHLEGRQNENGRVAYPEGVHLPSRTF